MASIQLKSSNVQRSGVTARHWNHESSSVSAFTGDGSAVRFRFNMDSKGGGKTDVLLTIGHADLGQILRKLAAEDPQAVAEIFAECSHMAVGGVMKLRAGVQSLDATRTGT